MPLFKSLTYSCPNGQTNAKLEGTMAASGVDDPVYSHLDYDDFNYFDPTPDYTVTTVGAGTAASTAGDGGLLLLTTTAGAADSVSVQRPTAGFAVTPGKQIFFKIDLALSDITTDNIIAGLIQTTATPFTVVNGIYLLKASGAATWTLNVTAASVTVSTPFPVTDVMVNNGFMELGFQVDLLGNVAGYFDPLTGTQTILNAIGSTLQARGRVCQLLANAITMPLPTIPLNPTFAIQNGSAVARTMTVDYFVVSNER